MIFRWKGRKGESLVIENVFTNILTFTGKYLNITYIFQSTKTTLLNSLI